MQAKSIPPLTPEQENRFWAKVEVPDQPSCCWEWSAGACRGYGNVAINGSVYKSHRVAYTLLIGPVPSHLTLDHLCRNRACVNPDHLQVVPVATNTRRRVGAFAIHCKYGHLLTPDNLYFYSNGRRACRTCRRHHVAAFRTRRKAEG